MSLHRRATVVLVEDRPLLRLGLREIIKRTRRLRVIGESDEERAALTLIGEKKPALAVVSVSMARNGGPRLIRRLKRQFPAVRVLALSHGGNRRAALQAGADAFILSTSDAGELSTLLRRLAEV